MEPTPTLMQEQSILTQPLPELKPRIETVPEATQSRPEVDLAAAALEATARAAESTGIDSNSNSIANQDIEWYNKGVGLIEDKKYRESLSCFDRALTSFADNDEMVIRILNGRGNVLLFGRLSKMCRIISQSHGNQSKRSSRKPVQHGHCLRRNATIF